MEERQLQPIYFALEDSDWRKALSESNRLLRKHPNHASAKALKALALARTGSTNEAQALSQSLLSTRTTLRNPHVQQGLIMTFRALRMQSAEIDLYKELTALDPGNEDLWKELFMACARAQNFAEQHKAAVRLNRDFGKHAPHYTWWLIASLALLVDAAPPSDPTRSLHLTLAQRMAEKAVAEDKLSNTEELRVYIHVLELVGDDDKIAALLGDPSADLARKIANDPDLVSRHIQVLTRTGMCARAMDLAVLSIEARDNWIDYKAYVSAVVRAVTEAAEIDEKKALVASVVDRVSTWAESRSSARCASLALVELAQELRAAADPVDLDGRLDLLDLIWYYIDGLGSKPTGYSDIMPYIVAHVDAAGPQALEAHKSRLEARIGGAMDSARESESLAQRWVTLEKTAYLLRALANTTDGAAWTARVAEMLRFGLDSDQAEQSWAACSDMVLLAAQTVAQSAFVAFAGDNSKLRAELFKALCILEAGIKQSSGAFLLKIYAIRMYLFMSCYSRARDLYSSLNIKHIQHDTLGYLVTGQGAPLGNSADDIAMCSNGTAFYMQSLATMGRSIESVYRNGTYSNIFDFVEFHDNIDHSLQRTCTALTASTLEALAHGDSASCVDAWASADVRRDAAQLHDNRDLAVFSPAVPRVIGTQWDLEFLTRPTPLADESWVAAQTLATETVKAVAADNSEALQTCVRRIHETQSAGLSPQDRSVLDGIGLLAKLYGSATDGKAPITQRIAQFIDHVAGLVVPDTGVSDAAVLAAVAHDAIRNLSAAAQLCSYAMVAKHALVRGEGKAAAKAIGAEVSRVRKEIGAASARLRRWAEASAEAIDEAWFSPDQVFLADTVDFLADRRMSAVRAVMRNLARGWTESLNNIVAQCQQ